MQSKIICPKCRAEIPLEDVNVATDLALCRQCGQTWNYSELIQDSEVANFVLQTPPKGVWFRETSPSAFEVGVSTRSAVAFFLVPFMCVWSGVSLGGIYGTQIAKKHFDLTASLFGIPFALGTLVVGGVAIMSICGKIVVTVEGDDGAIFNGVGPIGWRRRFNWRAVSAIRRTEKTGNRGSISKQITLEGGKQISFAAGT
jgi:hypothetical protein